MYADWKSLIDLSFDQGVAAIAVDGLQGSIAHDNDGSTRSSFWSTMPAPPTSASLPTSGTTVSRRCSASRISSGCRSACASSSGSRARSSFRLRLRGSGSRPCAVPQLFVSLCARSKGVIFVNVIRVVIVLLWK